MGEESAGAGEGSAMMTVGEEERRLTVATWKVRINGPDGPETQAVTAQELKWDQAMLMLRDRHGGEDTIRYVVPLAVLVDVTLDEGG